MHGPQQFRASSVVMHEPVQPVDERLGSERENPVGVEQDSEDDRGVPAHGVPGQNHATRFDLFPLLGQERGDAVDVRRDARQAPLIPHPVHVPHEDPVAEDLRSCCHDLAYLLSRQ